MTRFQLKSDLHETSVHVHILEADAYQMGQFWCNLGVMYCPPAEQLTNMLIAMTNKNHPHTQQESGHLALSTS